jgi:hypothetical protein
MLPLRLSRLEHLCQIRDRIAEGTQWNYCRCSGTINLRANLSGELAARYNDRDSRKPATQSFDLENSGSMLAEPGYD